MPEDYTCETQRASVNVLCRQVSVVWCGVVCWGGGPVPYRELGCLWPHSHRLCYLGNVLDLSGSNALFWAVRR